MAGIKGQRPWANVTTVSVAPKPHSDTEALRMRHGTGEAARQRRRQGGAHAVEYAIIFPVFFALLYGTMAYGTVFALRLGLQHAAEEGAREALRYQLPASPDQVQITLREAAAETAALGAASWVAGLGTLEAAADFCPIGTDCLTSGSIKLEDTLDCGETLADTCQVVVTLSYPYQAQPIFPSIPGLGLIMPERLQGRARLLVDGRALAI
jgi:Flp pilus assembly protein TadG